MGEIQTCFRRVEKKYLLTYAQYAAMKKGMASYVRPDAYSHYTLCNIYYDTPDYRLIQYSLEKPIYKEKLRVRSYGVPSWNDQVFVELKKKFDGVVYKRRVILGASDAESWLTGHKPATASQISREIQWFLHAYPVVPKVFIGYDREAYAGMENSELRITFDTNLRGRDWDLDLQCGDYGERILPAHQILMELKIPDSAPLWLSRLLSENGIFSSSFSKYGTYYKEIMGALPTWGAYLKGDRKYA